MPDVPRPLHSMGHLVLSNATHSCHVGPDMHVPGRSKASIEALGGRNPDLVPRYEKGDLQLSEYFDSSCASYNRDLSRSSTGFILSIGNGIISYASKLQRLSTQSSTECGLVALAQAAKKGTYLSGLLGEVRLRRSEPYTIRETISPPSRPLTFDIYAPITSFRG